MTELINTTGRGPVTMSSREIAELTGKEHKNVRRDIEVLLTDLGEDALKFEHIYIDSMNRQQKEYRLDRDLTENLLLGYSAVLRQKVLKRLRELEENATNPAYILNNPAALRTLLLENVEKVIALEARVEEMQEEVQAYEQLTEAGGTFSLTEAAKNLGVAPQMLIRWMKTNAWTYRRPGAKNDLAYQSKISLGYLEHRVSTGPRPDGTEWISTQVRVTAKGLAILAKAFPKAVSAA